MAQDTGGSEWGKTAELVHSELPCAPTAADKIGRLLEAVIAEVADRGYAATSVRGICAHADMDVDDFAVLFADKRECFVAAFELHADALLRAVSEAVRDSRDWQDSVKHGLQAFLGYLAEHPTAAQALLIDGLDAGPDALAIRDRAIHGFEQLIDLLQDRVSPPEQQAAADTVSEAAVGGVYEVISRRVRTGATEQLPRLGPGLAYALLAPVLGSARARRELARA